MSSWDLGVNPFSFLTLLRVREKAKSLEGSECAFVTGFLQSTPLAIIPVIGGVVNGFATLALNPCTVCVGAGAGPHAQTLVGLSLLFQGRSHPGEGAGRQKKRKSKGVELG